MFSKGTDLCTDPKSTEPAWHVQATERCGWSRVSEMGSLAMKDTKDN